MHRCLDASLKEQREAAAADVSAQRDSLVAKGGPKKLRERDGLVQTLYHGWRGKVRLTIQVLDGHSIPNFVCGWSENNRRTELA